MPQASISTDAKAILDKALADISIGYYALTVQKERIVAEVGLTLAEVDKVFKKARADGSQTEMSTETAIRLEELFKKEKHPGRVSRRLQHGWAQQLGVNPMKVHDWVTAHRASAEYKKAIGAKREAREAIVVAHRAKRTRKVENRDVVTPEGNDDHDKLPSADDFPAATPSPESEDDDDDDDDENAGLSRASNSPPATSSPDRSTLSASDLPTTASHPLNLADQGRRTLEEEKADSSDDETISACGSEEPEVDEPTAREALYDAIPERLAPSEYLQGNRIFVLVADRLEELEVRLIRAERRRRQQARNIRELERQKQVLLLRLRERYDLP